MLKTLQRLFYRADHDWRLVHAFRPTFRPVMRRRVKGLVETRELTDAEMTEYLANRQSW